MKRYLPCLTLLLLLHACSSGPSFKEPDGFGGMKWSASVEELQKFFEVHEYVNDTELKVYRTNSAFESVPVIAEFEFLNGGFVGVRLLFEPRYFGKMAKILEARYGPPSTEFPEKAGWLGKESSVYLVQHADEGSVARIKKNS